MALYASIHPEFIFPEGPSVCFFFNMLTPDLFRHLVQQLHLVENYQES